MNSVVLLTVDCLRRDHVGCYGYDRPTTPNIDSFASSATKFEGYANSPGTRWTFQTLHSGVFTSRIDKLGIPDDYKPLAKQFEDAGFATAGFVDNGWVSRDYGYDRGFDKFYSVQETQEESPMIKRVGQRLNEVVSDSLRDNVLKPIFRAWRESKRDRFQPSPSDADTVASVEQWIEDQSTPYFLWVHFMDAHTPYGYWPEHLRAIRGDAEIEHTIHPGNEGLITVGEDPPQNVIDTYDAGIRFVDEQIGRVLEIIDEDSTVAITGDHGEEFGQYNNFHKASLRQTMADVPLIIDDEGIDIDRTGEIGQHIDVPPTLLTAANISVPDHWDGNPIQKTSRTREDPVFYVLEGQQAVQRGDWKLIQEEEEGARLLELTEQNEVERSPHSGPFEELEQLLEDHLDSIEFIDRGYDESSMTNSTMENLEDLGYL